LVPKTFLTSTDDEVSARETDDDISPATVGPAGMTRWRRGAEAVESLIGLGRLQRFEADGPAALADALLERADRRLTATAPAALANGDIEGACAAACDAYRMAGEALLARQLLRASGGDCAQLAVEDAVAAQFAASIPAFGKAVSEQLRRLWRTAQYFDPGAPPVTVQDATWAIERAAAALSGTRMQLAIGSLGPFT
jgi:hypothetical protein